MITKFPTHVELEALSCGCDFGLKKRLRTEVWQENGWAYDFYSRRILQVSYRCTPERDQSKEYV